MELKDTIEMMTSSDYRERFVAEYRQLQIRVRKLHRVIRDGKNGKLDFKPDCPLKVLKKQESMMNQYLRVLEERAEIEGIDL